MNKTFLKKKNKEQTAPSSFTESIHGAIPIYFFSTKTFENIRETLPPFEKNWLETLAAPQEGIYLIPNSIGRLSKVLFKKDDKDPFWEVAALAKALPEGTYEIKTPLNLQEVNLVCIAWGLSSYRFSSYLSCQKEAKNVQLVWPAGANPAFVETAIEATTLVRDLINTPANDMAPHHLAAVAKELAQRFKAKITLLKGSKLLSRNFPTVYAVGRAADNEPYVIDITWTPKDKKNLKKLALVGKGVCFDTGGLDLKPSSNMLLMKKDMGGAAHVLALAYMIMALELPLALRVLIPAVENSVSGKAMRPLDVIRTRKGLTVEVGNTDAEGRLILCDALAAAAEDNPDLIIDCATLTGAARVALGPEIPALFSNNDGIADDLLKASTQAGEFLWRLPLFKPYERLFKSQVADLNNVGKSSFAGAIVAALFLEKFVPENIPWMHLDMMAWNMTSSPGRPEGGEAMGLRSLFLFLEKWCQDRPL